MTRNARRPVALATLVCGAVLLAGHPAAAATTRTVFVPTSASIHGNAGAFFHTDLWALNRSFSGSLTVTATYSCFAGPCGGAATATFTLSPRESKLFTDVDGVLLGRPETAGAITLTYESATADLAVTTRTYSPSLPSPTAGTAIPTFAAEDARTRTVFLGLGHNGGSLVSGFRSNAGAFNPSFSAAQATFTLYSTAGAVLGTATADVAPRSAMQINDVFTAAGAGSLVTTNAVLVVTSTLPVLAFVTVIDNQSGDSIYASPMDDVPPGGASRVANGRFDSGIASWTATAEIALGWSPTDASGNPGSGSLRVTNTAAVASQGGHEAYQCVAVNAGDLVNVAGRGYLASGQTNTGGLYVSAQFSSATDCSTLDLGSAVYAPSTGLTDAWVPVSAMGVAPAGTRSARVTAHVTKTEAGGSLTVLFDDISVVVSSR